MDQDKLLQILSDGAFHSGEELGLSFGGISRSAVWKQLQKLETLGVHVESRKGLGYRIDGGLDLLSASQVLAALSGSPADGIKLEVLTEVDSTNRVVFERLADSSDPFVCLAECQTRGRGRRGRHWVSPFAKNIYLSMSWAFSGGVGAVEGLSLAIGVAIVRALRGFGISDIQLKWPNDLVYQQRKLAGILLEMRGDLSGDCFVVIGVGFNVAMTSESAQGIDQAWVALNEFVKPPISRSHLAAAFVKEIVAVLCDYERRGFKSYRDEWNALDAYAEKEVSISLGEQLMLGIARGVDDSGALIVDTDAGRRSFSGGEVSLRLQ